MIDFLAVIGALYVAFQIFNLITFIMLWRLKRKKKKLEAITVKLKQQRNVTYQEFCGVFNKAYREFIEKKKKEQYDKIIDAAENIRDNYKVDEHE